MASAPKADRIETSPPAATEPPRKLSKLALLWGFVRHYPGKLIGALIALVVAATATLAIPRGFMLVIDKGFAGAGGTGDLAPYFYVLRAVVRSDERAGGQECGRPCSCRWCRIT